MAATHLPVVQPSDAVGKRVRTGPWADQAVSTYRKIAEALEGAGDDPASGGGERERAAQLIDYFMEEAKVIYLAVDTLVPRLLEWSAGAGATTDEVEAELARLRGLLRYPDGSPYEPVEGWKGLGARAGALSAQVRGADLTVAEATAELEGLRHQWQLLHDRHLDFLGGVVGYVGRRFGEEAIGEAWRYVLEPFVRERYFVFDTRRQPYEESLERNLYIAFESMRGHLVGPARTGDIELEEHDDRYVLRFDPCSSGGRFLRGDPEDGTPSRVLPPYGYGVTQEPHPWSWGETGVCYYCTHCNFALSLLPAEQWGHPVRTVDPPLWRGPDDPMTRKQCQWTIWKSLEAIPEREYERIGRTKPKPGDAAAEA